MPDSKIYKAGKLSFLLVCLFLCTACGSEKAVFEAGEAVVLESASEEPEQVQMPEETQKAQENPTAEPEETKEETPVSGKININTAHAEELMTLPGIGESRAKAIIEYRQSVGEFEKIEELMNVKGIGTGIFSKLSSLICVK